jgi:hypothetical protein
MHARARARAHPHTQSAARVRTQVPNDWAAFTGGICMGIVPPGFPYTKMLDPPYNDNRSSTKG